MNKDRVRRLAVRNLMTIADQNVKNLESVINHAPSGCGQVLRDVWREELKLWKRVQAMGVREAQKLDA